MVSIEGRVVTSGTTRTNDASLGFRLSGGGALDRLMASEDTLARFAAHPSHTVRAGDTLSGIAQHYGTSWQTLARINGIADPDRIAIGQKIRLPAGSVGTSAATNVHVVRSGETLSGIAAADHVGVAAIARQNGIANPDRIMPGQELVIGAPAKRRHTAPVTTSPRTTRPAVTMRSNGTVTTPSNTSLPAPGAASLRAADIAAERAAGRHSGGKCYAWVKQALQRSGAVADYLPGVAAKGAGPALEARGFINLLDRPGNAIRSPYDAPKGAVLVYGAAPGATDRNARYGHIEIRTSNGFASDYASVNARTGNAANGLGGNGRVLIGVYVKPDAAAATVPAARTVHSATTTSSGAYGAENLNLGTNERFRPAILEAAQRTGMTPQTVSAIINAETLKDANGVWQTNAKAGTSSATGMTQFLSSTWVGEATRPGGVLNAEVKARGLVDASNHVIDRDALLAARNDPRLSILAGADYARTNVAALTRGGYIPADASPAAIAKYAYLAHHEGLGGARGFLSGDMRYLRSDTFEANVPRSQRQAYLSAAGGSEPLAYRNWLSDYTDARIDVRHFMHASAGMDVPATRSLFR